MKRSFIILISVLFFSFSFFSDLSFSQTQTPAQITKDKALQYAKPKKPIKIKLHRDKKGEYSWDITGESVDEIIRADRRLRQLFKEE